MIANATAKVAGSLPANSLPWQYERGRVHEMESLLGRQGSLVSWNKPAYVCSGVCNWQA